VAERPGGDITRIGLQAWAEALHNEAIHATAKEKYGLLRGHFVDVARRTQADGTVDPDTDPEYIAQVMFALDLTTALQLDQAPSPRSAYWLPQAPISGGSGVGSTGGG